MGNQISFRKSGRIFPLRWAETVTLENFVQQKRNPGSMREGSRLAGMKSQDVIYGEFIILSESRKNVAEFYPGYAGSCNLHIYYVHTTENTYVFIKNLRPLPRKPRTSMKGLIRGKSQRQRHIILSIFVSNLSQDGRRDIFYDDGELLKKDRTASKIKLVRNKCRNALDLRKQSDPGIIDPAFYDICKKIFNG